MFTFVLHQEPIASGKKKAAADEKSAVGATSKKKPVIDEEEYLVLSRELSEAADICFFGIREKYVLLPARMKGKIATVNCQDLIILCGKSKQLVRFVKQFTRGRTNASAESVKESMDTYNKLAYAAGEKKIEITYKPVEAGDKNDIGTITLPGVRIKMKDPQETGPGILNFNYLKPFGRCRLVLDLSKGDSFSPDAPDEVQNEWQNADEVSRRLLFEKEQREKEEEAEVVRREAEGNPAAAPAAAAAPAKK